MAADDGEEYVARGVRPFWSGTITFGLVSVPVNLFPATTKQRVSFRMLTEEGAPVRRRYVCSKDEAELDSDDIVRGYEIEKGKFVTVEDDELEAIEPRKTREIDLQLFVNRDEIDPIFFERGYFLTPAAGSNKAYRLLAEVMERSNQAGIATFVMRTKEYLIQITAEKGIMRAETLRFQDEVRSAADVGLTAKPKAKPAEVKKFEKLIAGKTKKLDLSLMLDDYAEKVQELAERKRKAGEDVVRVERSDDEDEGNVIDIMEALQRSLGGESPKRSRAAASRKTTRKKPASTKRKSAKKSGTKTRKRAAGKKKRTA